MRVRKWEILAIVIVAVVAFALLYFRPFSLQPPSNGSSLGELTISSFDSDVLHPLADGVELEIFDYGIERNSVVCYGIVHLREGVPVSGAKVGMLIRPGPENSVHVEVYLYKGELALPNDNLDFDFRNIPVLSEGDEFQFSLTCSLR